MSKDEKKKTLEQLSRTSTFRSTKQGYIEEWNIETGELIKVHGMPKGLSVANDTYHEVELSDGKVILVSSQVDPVHYVNNASVKFSWMLVDLICQKVREGDSLTKICKTEGYPSYALLCTWRREYPEIDTMLDQAREDRSETFHDKIIDIIETDAINRTDVDDRKLKVEASKWIAEKGNRARYGNSTKVEFSGKVSHAVLVVETGVRKNIEGVVVDETAKIREAQRIEEEGEDE